MTTRMGSLLAFLPVQATYETRALRSRGDFRRRMSLTQPGLLQGFLADVLPQTRAV